MGAGGERSRSSASGCWLSSRDEVKDAGVPAAWIKVSAGDDGITEIETKILRAAAAAGT